MNKQLIIKIAWDRFEKQWRFESTSYNGKELLPIEESNSPLPLNARAGVNALCLLGVASILDQMDQAKVGHSEAIRELLSPLWNGKKNKWLKTLFGPKGFQEALVEYEQNKKPSVKLASHVEVRFIPPKSSEKKLPNVLEEIIEQRLHRHHNSLRSGLEIRLITPCQVISSFDQEGELEEGDQLKIEVHCKESQHLFVAWFTCFGKEPVELYPINSLKMRNKEPDHTLDAGRKIVRIPKIGCVEVDRGPGLETCFVAVKESSFSPEQRKKMVELIGDKLKSRGKAFPPQNAYVSKYQPDRPKGAVSFNVRPPSPRKKWEQDLAASLQGLADKIWLFNLPNNG